MGGVQCGHHIIEIDNTDEEDRLARYEQVYIKFYSIGEFISGNVAISWNKKVEYGVVQVVKDMSPNKTINEGVLVLGGSHAAHK